MPHPDTWIHVLAILYGLLLMTASFRSGRLLEAMRVDALFIKAYSDKTRPLNLVIGLLVAGYAVLALWTR